MLVKNIFGILILFFNMMGLVYFIYLAATKILDNFSSGKKVAANVPLPIKKKKPLILKTSIIPDEDDLLKDMDLSDLDDLNLDDFD